MGIRIPAAQSTASLTTAKKTDCEASLRAGFAMWSVGAVNNLPHETEYKNYQKLLLTCPLLHQFMHTLAVIQSTLADTQSLGGALQQLVVC